MATVNDRHFATIINQFDQVTEDGEVIKSLIRDHTIDLIESEFTPSEKRTQLLALDQALRSQLDTAAILAISKTVLVDLRSRTPQLPNLRETYEQRRQAAIAEYSGKPPAQKYYSSRDYRYFREKAHDIGPNAHRPFRMCEIHDDLDATAGHDDDDDDEDIRVEAVTKDYRCYITRRIMDAEVWTTRTCNHSFSSAILDMLRRARAKVQCPAPSCDFLLCEANLERDRGLEREIKVYLEREKERRAAGDDGVEEV
ncbi:hypothetical protein SeMB42_g00169 [Synchytrium endobioticum]|uniref:SP-RING-type domain-containing protein n=1 Tax=Synchytrium endobioticum TaxID=286115 RepID=A0A507DUV3_9FUNG|nr:hypothetical protein SeLEV6574_g02616 [Synchytrium endobioticum]TPX54660.1 hypothetical protein SeMB42_g00169 [Synchytrium endobioticum]